MKVTTKWNQLVAEAPDPIVQTMGMYFKDQDPRKIDVSIGVYKGEKGEFYTFPTVKEAKDILRKNDPGHNYTNMAGIPEFVSGARKVIFGNETEKIVSLQTISGTGSLHMAMLFLKSAGYSNYYLGVPSWSNYVGMIKHVGGQVTTYNYYDKATGTVDFESMLNALNECPENSVFLIQACCHNPTGADLSRDQWKQIAPIIKQKNLIPLIDIAYQGFSSGNKDEDAWGIRYFYSLGMEFLVCQSFAKNMGLYGERVGALHVVVQDSNYMPNAQSTLVALFRNECSFAPAFGARIASIIFGSPELKKSWDKDVDDITVRLKQVRQIVYQKLIDLKTPGNWDSVIKQNGLFWYSGLTPEQNEKLISEHHVYSTSIGRVNIAGLNNSNIDYFCNAVDSVVRSTI
jgi:aspartate aminotransferase